MEPVEAAEGGTIWVGSRRLGTAVEEDILVREREREECEKEGQVGAREREGGMVGERG